MRVNKGIKSPNTQLVLESSKGARVDAFVRGEHPELVIGATLVDVKLELKQSDTIVYYMLEQYKIMDAQQQAA